MHFIDNQPRGEQDSSPFDLMGRMPIATIDLEIREA